MRIAWAPKSPVLTGPLQGEALKRLRNADTGTLKAWIDNSLCKIGTLVNDNDSLKYAHAQQEAAALVQALSELVGRTA